MARKTNRLKLKSKRGTRRSKIHRKKSNTKRRHVRRSSRRGGSHRAHTMTTRSRTSPNGLLVPIIPKKSEQELKKLLLTSAEKKIEIETKKANNELLQEVKRIEKSAKEAEKILEENKKKINYENLVKQGRKQQKLLNEIKETLYEEKNVPKIRNYRNVPLEPLPSRDFHNIEGLDFDSLSLTHNNDNNKLLPIIEYPEEFTKRATQKIGNSFPPSR